MTGVTQPDAETASRLTEADQPASESQQIVAPDDAVVPPSGGPMRWPFWLPLVVLIVGLVVTGALALVSRGLYNNNEKRLLDLHARELGAVLAQALPNTQTPLASAAALADATNGNPRKFMQFIAPYVGSPPAHQFVSVSLWRVGSPQRTPLAIVGERPALIASSPDPGAFFTRAAKTRRLTLTGLLQNPSLRLGYAFTTPGPTSLFAAYGESAIPSNRRSRLERNAAFSELNYAIYLGASPMPQSLLVTSLSHPPIRGRHSTLRVPFGDTTLTLVVAARQPLAGTLPQRLPWIILIAGVALTLGAAALTVRLLERRRAAEQLATSLELAVEENRRLYAEQRTIAQTLQHALLPQQLPQIPGAEASARYVPGEKGVEIGGDWYDVIPVGEQRLLVVVGDVTGRGLRAAATMASLRYAILAYAAQNDPPATILTKLSGLLSVHTDGQLASVLCSVVDLAARQLTVTSAGHLPPLLISGDRAEYVLSLVGPPIGVEAGAEYRPTTVAVPSAATLLAFTDGLVERRDEPLDDSLARLRDAAKENHMELSELLSTLIAMRSEPSEDDTAIVGVRWSA